ncbi:MAG: sigma-70 family RNA polymerase sigma factor [Candidatus Brocadiia bacterium]|nr:MAG: sigma-70 family RNA polymerase sigma factor [Candidatus Brocadiia bacterium]
MAKLEGPELTTSSDKMLVRAVLAGDKAAYENLYDRYAPLIRAVCYYTAGNLADAQDLAQDVFMWAYKNLDQLRDPDRFGKWLIGIARLRCHEWLRWNLRRQDNRVELSEAQIAIPEPPDDDRIELLRKMIATLPEKERLALHTFYLQGNSADNARRIMGLSRSGYYRVLDRARKRLKQLMHRERKAIR